MKQCLYASRALRAFTAEELEELLRLARESNHARQLTGLLVYGHGGFVQVVEGPEAEVDALFARIARDPRHEVLMHTTRSIEGRHFPEWQMGYRRLDAAGAGAVPGFSALFEEGVKPGEVPGLDALACDLINSLRKAALAPTATATA